MVNETRVSRGDEMEEWQQQRWMEFFESSTRDTSESRLRETSADGLKSS